MQRSFNDDLLCVLACPHDRSKLLLQNDALVCTKLHRFPIENGIPVFARNPRREPVPLNMGPCPQFDRDGGASTPVDPFVNDWIVNTNGNLYRRVRGRLSRYPIPKWRFARGDGKLLVDIGCSWGRWSIAAARAGFRPIGMDVHIDALAAAGRVSQQLDARADFVCGDAEHLPFLSGSVDFVFSYSVLQHIDKPKVLRIISEISRVLKPAGSCLIQLPNTFGASSIIQQLKRGFREAKSGTFEMRYWSHGAMRRAFQGAGFSKVLIRTDGFFSQNPQLTDLDLLSPVGKLAVLASYAGRRTADAFPFLTHVADSLWVEAQTFPANQ